MSWNCNGIKNKYGDLHYAINHYKPKIIFLNETKLGPTDKLKLKNYTTIRADRNHLGGGVACLIDKTIQHKRISNIRTGIEHITIEINNNLWISGGYAPENSIQAENDLGVFFPRNARALLVGDLNAKQTAWMNNRNNRAGNILLNFILNNPNITLHHPDAPTHYPSNGNTPSILDIALTKGMTDINIRTETTLSSDHLPIFIKWKDHPPNAQHQLTYDYKNVNWTTFRQRLNNITAVPAPISCTRELERQVEIVTSNITSIRNQMAPMKPMKPKIESLPADILNLIQQRNRLKRAWQRRPNNQDKELIKLYNNEIEKGIRLHRNKVWMEYISTLAPQDNSLWKLTRTLKRTGLTQTDLIIDDKHIYKEQDKANAFADHFANIFDETPDTSETQNSITKATDTFALHKYPIPPNIACKLLVSPQEIKTLIKNLPSRKAPGPDTINNLILKNLPRKTIIHLMHIFNAIITLQHFPKAWKHANIIVFPKPGKDQTLINSYRPISLLCSMGKLAEKLFLRRLSKTIDELHSLPPEQFGFRPEHNTTLAVAKVAQDASLAFNSKHSTAILLLDIEKAFDKVWHKGLIYKLYAEHNIPLYFTSLINSYLQDRTFAIKLHNATSATKAIRAGVPQGTVLSPTLFSLYIADIPKTEQTKILMYADDTAIYSSAFAMEDARVAINRHVNIIKPYLDTWKIKLNVPKSELLVVTRKRTNIDFNPPLQIDNIQIETKTQVKYLGIILDKTLRGLPQVNHTLTKAHVAETKLATLLRPSSCLSPYNKIQLYKTIIRPTLLYGAPAWSYISKTQKQRIQRYQNRFLKKALYLPMDSRTTDVHRLADISTIDDYFTEVSSKFFNKTLVGPTFTRDLTALRHDDRQHIVHKPIYHRLPIFYQPLIRPD